MKVQERIFQTKIEKRSKDGESDCFRGNPIVFNSLSEDVGGFKEVIARSAWDTADFSECVAVFNHREDMLLGTYAAGTLRFVLVDDNSVSVEIDKSETSISRDMDIWVSRGEIDKMSFKFTIADDGSEWTRDEATDTLIRTVTKLGKIYDVSPVTRPAYQATQIRSGVSAEDLQEVRSMLSPVTEEDGSRDFFEYKLKLNKYLQK